MESLLSLPSWERGLKSVTKDYGNRLYLVAPLVGAWIEIKGIVKGVKALTVAPLVGAWIEI